MRLIVLIIPLISPFFIFAQLCNSSILSDASQICGRNFDSADCQYFINFANNKIRKDSFYIPEYYQINNYLFRKALSDSEKITADIFDRRFAPRFSSTAEEILMREYGLIEEYTISDIVPRGKVCFDLVMHCAIEKKMGSNFIDSIKLVADSLYRNGKGFKEIAFKSKIPLDSFIKHTFLQLDSIKQNPKLALAINFEVTKNGRVKNPEYSKTYYEGQMEVDFEKLENGKLKRDMEKIFLKMEWSPAYLRGIPVNDKKYLVINLNWN